MKNEAIRYLEEIASRLGQFTDPGARHERESVEKRIRQLRASARNICEHCGDDTEQFHRIESGDSDTGYRETINVCQRCFNKLTIAV